MSSYFSGASGTTSGTLTAYNCTGDDIDMYYWLPVGEGRAAWSSATTVGAGKSVSKSVGTAAGAWYTSRGAPAPTDAAFNSPSYVQYSAKGGPLTYCISGVDSLPSLCSGGCGGGGAGGTGGTCTSCGGGGMPVWALVLAAVLLAALLFAYVRR